MTHEIARFLAAVALMALKDMPAHTAVKRVEEVERLLQPGGA